MRNILLVQPNFTVGTDVTKEHYLPYSVGLLWAYAKQFKEITDNFQVTDIIFKREPADDVLSNIDEPHIAVFSNYMWNWEYNKVLAAKLKEKYPNCIIMFGGPQVTDNPAKHLLFFQRHKYVSLVVNGEGEHVFYNILKEILDGKTLRRVYKTERIGELDTIPSPYLSGVFDKIIADNPGTVWQMVLETNRGCPFQCTFCDWGGTTYSKIKKFGLERFFAEVYWACAHKVRLAFIADANFGIFYERDKEIAQKLIEIQKETGNDMNFSVTWNKNSQKKTLEIAEILSARGLTIALQSTDETVLKAIKRDNMEVSNMKGMLEECTRRNIPVYSELILGLPHETYDTWKNGLYNLLNIGLHTTIDGYFLTLLENSELNLPEQHEEHGLQCFITDFNNTHDDDIAEKQIIVRGTKYMPTEDMVRSYMFIWMMIAFHYSGLTQIYARYLNKKHNVSFQDFYDKLWIEVETEGTLFNSHYKETAGIIDHFFATGEITDLYCTHKIGWNTIISMFEDLPQTISAVEEFTLMHYKDLIPHEVTEFQRVYNIDINKEYPCKFESKKNVYGYIFKNENYNESSLLEFGLNFKYTDKREFLRRMYLNRRAGGAKVHVMQIKGLK